MEAATTTLPPGHHRAAGLIGARRSQGHAALKRDIRAGRLTVIDALDDPRAIGSVRLADLLLATPRLGKKKVPRLLHRVGISLMAAYQHPVEQLTEGQRERLRQGLEDPSYSATALW